MKLQLNYNKILPPSGFSAITIFNKLYRRDIYRDKPISKVTYNHESIHLQQELDFVFGCERLYILGGCIFYVLYFIEWLIKAVLSLFTGFKIKSYKSISFEQESYANQKDFNYLDNRKRFNWVKYIFKVIK